MGCTTQTFLFLLLFFLVLLYGKLFCSEFAVPVVKRDSAGRHCEEHILKVEERFNSRREARRNYAHSLPSQFAPTEKKLYDIFEPEAICISEERFGGSSEHRYASFGDGPKFVCGVDFMRARQNATNSCLVYSIGASSTTVSGRIDYERAVHRVLGCETHTFDPTLGNETFLGSDYATFHPWGLGEDGGETTYSVRGGGSFSSMSLASMMKALGHTGRRLDILKVDCEGCEWQALPAVFDAIARGELLIDQIQIELHRGTFEGAKSLFEKADSAGMRVLHKERNQWGCDGWRCLEYVFVGETFLNEVHAWQLCGMHASMRDLLSASHLLSNAYIPTTVWEFT
mmetsp:Transcript_33330/g.73509  ORF Transcript_33330/g.73509 Transcript_33330/m.73509 type:complete len:342 (-) Transcript_33330:523-1548(-)